MHSILIVHKKTNRHPQMSRGEVDAFSSKPSQIRFTLVAILSFWCCTLVSAQERVISLAEAHSAASREPGAKTSPDTGPFSGMTHSEWTESDGAPGSVSSLAQTTDGYLWIGSSLGLYRFDGIHFEAYPFSAEQVPLQTQDIASLAADPNGGLWIGLRMPAIVHLHADGSAVSYGSNSGLHSDAVERIAVRKDGSVWILAAGKLMTLQEGHWIRFGADCGLGQGTVFSFYFDRDDTMWAAQDHRLMVLRKGARKFEKVPASVFFVSGMTQPRNGPVMMADAWRTVRAVDQTSRSAKVRLQGRANLLADTHGNLWIAEDYFGLTRAKDADKPSHGEPLIEHASSSQRLTSPEIGGILEDADGNIWVGTALGLDRYQETSFEQFRGAELNFYPSVIGARDGSVWINSHGEPLMRWFQGKLRTFGAFVTNGPLANRSNGDVCFVDARANELQCYGSDRATYVVLDKRIEYAPAQAMVEDADGSLLISFEGKGIWRYNGSWERFEAAELPSVSPVSMYLDSLSRLWLGFQGDRVAVRIGSHFQILQVAQGSWANTLTFCEGAGEVWLAGSSGLAFFDGGRIERVQSKEGIFNGTSGIVFDRMGNLWLNSGAGALRVTSGSVARLLGSADHSADAEVFNERDGLTGKPTQLKPTPSLVADAHGRLWFATAGNLVSVDPQNFAEPVAHFNVIIESFVLDGHQMLPNGPQYTTFQARAANRHTLSVNFAAPNLSSPERLTYRYQLVGEDGDWQAAGSRRQAFYTRLGPGKYVFKASVREGDGQWLDLQMPLQIEILPMFYQTAWFDAVVALCVMLLILGGYRIRERQVGRTLRLLAEERSLERVKIARDLHDTLLQGIYGLMLRFHYAARKVSDNAERAGLESALATADEILAEGRERVRHLRTSPLPAATLADSILMIGKALNAEGNVEFSVRIEGTPRVLLQPQEDEIFCIARESLTNAFEHANASSITVTIDYGKSSFSLKCRDNGRGMDSGTQRDGTTGHWGLQGMRERARHVGARFESKSAPGAGTEIAVVLPNSRI